MWWPFAKDDPRLQKVDAFQLENLVNNQIRFYFYDLRRKPEKPATGPLARVMTPSEPVSESDLLQKLLTPETDRFTPIVLLCEKGRTSARVARRLMDQEFINVYVVDGGFRELEKSRS